MPPSSRSRVAGIVALAGSAIVGMLFLAATAGIGMTGMHRIGQLRLAPSTIALVLLPVPAVAWVKVLWARPLPNTLARVLRIVATLVLVAVAVGSAALTLFVIIVRPVERISGPGP